jgi:hypothetical protein
MRKDTKVLEKVMALKRDLDADWTEELKGLNIWIDLEGFYKYIMYDRKTNRRVANTIFTYIVLNYDASSDFLEPSRDRTVTTRKVMVMLAGQDSLKTEIYLEALLGDDLETENGKIKGPINKVKGWYIDRQKDWRFSDVVSGYEFHAKATMFLREADSSEKMKEAAQVMEMGNKLRLNADKLLLEIQKEYSDLDKVLDDEGTTPLTDRLEQDHLSFELSILKRNNQAKRALELSKAQSEN